MQVLFQTAEISLNLTKSVLSSLDLTKKNWRVRGKEEGT